MELVRVKGVCDKCSQFQMSEGMGNKEDAVMFFRQEHYQLHGHWFEGELEVSYYPDMRHSPSGRTQIKCKKGK